ncbi:hypothetical protein SKAU_G00393800 [Synaphobranchus kaupii]|uniref:Uncharacterized protein n=1 Tax=Synaphobranchus kaupii TaxID=118154 RepID=A0A9Q1EC35_SYNKA|nr:hypothetical protein SKAU_G00393800 [Synaphobranchus kaupii]
MRAECLQRDEQITVLTDRNMGGAAGMRAVQRVVELGVPVCPRRQKTRICRDSGRASESARRIRQRVMNVLFGVGGWVGWCLQGRQHGARRRALFAAIGFAAKWNWTADGDTEEHHLVQTDGLGEETMGGEEFRAVDQWSALWEKTREQLPKQLIKILDQPVLRIPSKFG